MNIALLSLLATGFVLGLLGGGGSILTVPILVYLFKLKPVIATAYSLFIVGSAASVGALKNYKTGHLDLKTGLTFAIPGFLGVFISRSYIIPKLPDVIVFIHGLSITKDKFILLVFAILMIAASYSMILGRSTGDRDKPVQSPLLALLGFNVGILTGFVGAGGGFIIIPVLNNLAGLDIKKSIGTSLFIIALNSLIGFSGDLINFQPDWVLLLKLSTLAIIGVLTGSYFTSKVPAKILKKGFGVFVLSLGAWMVYAQIG